MIREFRETDIERLIEIINKGYSIREENFIKEIKDADKQVFVYDDGVVKGFSFVETYSKESLEFVLNVYVDPNERGQGIGKALYKEGYKTFENRKINALITTFKAEKGNETFYKNLGFEKWYGCYTMRYKGEMQPESNMKFVPYEDKYYEIFAKARQEGFYELRRENDIKPYLLKFSEGDRKSALDIKDYIYLAFDGEKLISLAHVEGGSLERIIVTPEYRGQGYGRKTTQSAINKALSNGEKFITLEVVESNISAIKLYRSLGFENHLHEQLYRVKLD